MKDQLICGDCLKIIPTLRPNSIDLVVTSPPYDGLRDYQGYILNFENIALWLYKVSKHGGVVVWVIGDQTISGSESGTSFRQALHFKNVGFNLHDTMIYQKNSFANPSSNRYHQIFEYMFVFSKGKPKTFNPIKDRKNKYAGQSSWGKNTVRQKDGSLKERKKTPISEYGTRFNIWKYNVGGCGQSASDDIAHQHPAIFPEQLAADHIISWSDPEDWVLDPFCGSGTTCKMAKKLGRHYIGIDISQEYIDLSQRRLDEIVYTNLR